MSSPLEYHLSVRHSFSASVAFFSLLVLPLIFVSTSPAQINGTPASVTSPGFGGRAVNGPAASVTSLGPRGFAPPNSHVTFSTSNQPRTIDGHRRRHHDADFIPPVVYAVPVPYAVDLGATDNGNNDDDITGPSTDDNYQGGPTIFDRRGSGAASYIPPVNNAPRPYTVQSERCLFRRPRPPSGFDPAHLQGRSQA